MDESTMLIAIAIVTAIIELTKQINFPKKFSLILALILGLGFNILFVKDAEIAQIIMDGLIIGLSAVGLYSGPKNLVEGITHIREKEEV